MIEPLREFRSNRHGGTMRSMAKDLRVSKSYYQKLEYGEKPITPHIMSRLYGMHKKIGDEDDDKFFEPFGFQHCDQCGNIYEKCTDSP
ncbi:MAG: helix-turn-helix domain-containing protein [Firmicutes bacterium]|nr:helix-turn-helix domain-containing protein [Bacillota bacterium]